MSNELTRAEARRLEQYEATIQDGLNSFVEMARALRAIREEQLFPDDYESFEDYCQGRWRFGKRYANYLISSMEAAEDVADVETVAGTIVPTSEAVAREIAKVETEEGRADLWAKAVETAPQNHEGVPIVTAAHVAKTRRELFPEDPKPVNYPEKVQRILEKLNSAVQEAEVDPSETLWQKVLAYVLQLKQKLEGHSVKPAKFIRPTETEVAAYLLEYCKEKGIRTKVLASDFVDYYDACGWKTNKGPMKDWKAAVRLWVNRDPVTKERRRGNVKVEQEKSTQAYRIITAGRKKGLSDEEITKQLNRHGLEWPA